MSFFDDLLNFFSSLFGGKKDTVTKVEQEPVKVNAVDYEIPAGVRNMLALIYQHQNMTEAEQTDLEGQIKVMGSLGHTHYVIHTHGRGDTNPVYPLSGDRYYELDYLLRAKTMAVITDTGGLSKDKMIAKGLEPIVYENLLS